MNVVRKKRNQFASRAHSFKENLLDVLKHGQAGGSPHRRNRVGKEAIVLAKKTGSTDNLTGHLGTAKSTDCLIKEVQFALKYFQDVVAKQAYDMLPGCATVVLETVLAIQAFAGSLSSPPEPEVVSALHSAYRAVAALTAWADAVILGEAVSGDEVAKVVEPVRCAVIVLVNCISVRVAGCSSLGRGSSLPDITRGEEGEEEGLAGGPSSHSIRDMANQKPPLLPRLSGPPDSAPPLPPKLARPRFDRSFEDLLAQSYSLQSRALGDLVPPLPPHHMARARSMQIRMSKSLLDRSLPSPSGMDTTLPDLEPVTASQESLEETDCVLRQPSVPSLSPFSHSWSSRDRSATSSPSLETLSFSSQLSSSPPAIPRKARGATPDTARPFPTRKMSQYDNLPEPEAHQLRRAYDVGALRMPRSDSFPLHSSPAPHTTWARVARARAQGGPESPPPLPPKKRNIMSYMEMFGKSIIPSGEDLLQGLFHPHDLLHNVWQHNFHEYSEYAPSSLLSFPLSDHGSELVHPYINIHLVEGQELGPPALPPKRSSRSHPGSFRSDGSEEGERIIPIHREPASPLLPPPPLTCRLSAVSADSSSSSEQPRLAEVTRLARLSVPIPIQRVVEEDREEGRGRAGGEEERDNSFQGSQLDMPGLAEEIVYGVLASEPGSNGENNNKAGVASGEVRAGSVDALIILATQTIKNDFLYQEAFLTTYRTFIKPEVLIAKLVYRFRKFSGPENGSLRLSRAAFSLLVRVVDSLAEVDFLNKVLLEKLTDFITSLIKHGNLGLARALRSQFILKYEERRTRLLPDFDISNLSLLSGRRPCLLHFKSVEVAEQMTLLDSQLFQRIDSAELLTWVQEQAEEKSLNLTKFTEHFNNMSYWTRTMILQQPDAKERERYVMKFIKIMKWLRKMNNFNSYLAILSALDSAPIRRLEWQKNITDGLKEYCSLIDSSSSFRAYRLALAEATPPCIPYIGLVLQDLTFVQIGNPDLIEGKINFSKRWQQFNILDNMRRFRKEQYQLLRQEEIILFFSEFEDYLTEDEMWALSETLKPRGGPKVAK